MSSAFRFLNATSFDALAIVITIIFLFGTAKTGVYQRILYCHSKSDLTFLLKHVRHKFGVRSDDIIRIRSSQIEAFEVVC